MTDEKIGDLNGGWSKAFRIMIGLNLALLGPALAWAAWITFEILELRYITKLSSIDRFSASMFIEVQDELSSKNPDVKWLSASDVRTIQQRNPPYRDR